MRYISWLECQRRQDDRLKMTYPTDAAAKYFVAMALKGIYGLPQRCYSLLCTPNAPNPSQTATIAAFLLRFYSKSRAPPAKNGSATATITIKPERLAHLCVEQALLYPWMCFTSWFELHRSQDERFSAPSSVNFTDLFAVSDRGVSIMIAVAL